MNRSLDGVIIKKANRQERFTKKQVNELEKCLNPVTGVFHFLENYFNIQHPIKGRLIYKAYPFQLKLLHTYHNYRFNVNLLPRQTGKTTTALQIAANCQKKENGSRPIIYLDGEGRLKAMNLDGIDGLDRAKMHVVHSDESPLSAEDFLDIIIKLIR